MKKLIPILGVVFGLTSIVFLFVDPMLSIFCYVIAGFLALIS